MLGCKPGLKKKYKGRIFNMKLWDLKPQELGVITDINTNHPGAERLNIYGFTRGQTAKLLFKTSFGGPKVFLLEDTIYSLSFELASQIFIEKKSL